MTTARERMTQFLSVAGVEAESKIGVSALHTETGSLTVTEL